MADETEVVREQITGPLAGIGLVVEEVRAHAAGKHRKVTVVVDLDADSSEAVSFEHVEQGTRLVGELLDEVTLWRDNPYTLEVTSPGAERELTLPRHFRRAVGRRVRITTEHGEHEGVLTAVDTVSDPATLTLDAAGGPVRTALSEVAKAQVLVSLR